MNQKHPQKLSLQEYIDKDGISCPFCGEEGGVEGSHSFDHLGQGACLDVVCILCGENYREVYRFSCWKNENEEAQSKTIESCPECGADISDENCENLIIESGGIVQGEINCPDCEAQLVPIFKLSNWEKD